MAKTLFKRLEENSAVLKYSLRFSLPEKSDYLHRDVDDIGNVAFDMLFSEREFNFFGYVKERENPNSQMLSYLNRKKIWGRIFLDEALTCLYSELRDSIGANSQFSSYQAVSLSYATDSKKVNGLGYLMQSGKLTWGNLPDSIALWKAVCKTIRTEQGISPEEARSSCSYYLKSLTKASELLRVFPNYEALLIEAGERNTIPLSSIEMADILRIPGAVQCLSETLCGESVNTKENMIFSKYLENRKKIVRCIIGGAHANPYLSYSDRIYLERKIEFLFGFRITDALWKNIKALVTDAKRITNVDVGLLAYCGRLPNVFSRHYLLQMACDAMDDLDSMPRYGFFSELAHPESIVTEITVTKDDTYIKQAYWRLRYQQMMNYFCLYAFPVYKGLFTALIMRNFTPTPVEDWTETNKQEIPAEILLYLEDYLNRRDVYEKIVGADGSGSVLPVQFPDHVLRPDFKEVEKEASAAYLRCFRSINSPNNKVRSSSCLSSDDIDAILPPEAGQHTDRLRRVFEMWSAGISEDFRTYL